MIVSCEASSNFTKECSKMIVSCEASSKFRRKSFQNDRFARGFIFQNERFAGSLLQISQKKLPKRAFRARLPSNFTEKASKIIISREASSKSSVWREASSNFHRTINASKTQSFTSPGQCAEQFQELKIAFCHSFAQSTHRILYERVHPAKSKCASRYNGVPSKISTCVSLQGVRKMYASSA